MRPRDLTAAVVVVVLAVAAACAPSAARAAGMDARVVGTFRMQARVTSAVNVRGEHVGQILLRQWTITARGCHGDRCRLLVLRRQRAAGRHARLRLRRTGPGRYAGAGSFYAALRCNGRVYRHGSRVPYRITLTVSATTVVGGVPFASALTATYRNRRRIDTTRCPLGPSRDAARYTGAIASGLPAAPQAAFAEAVDAQNDTARFTGTSSPGPGGSPLVASVWSFGDPASGAANGSTAADPVHRFSAPGAYVVSLTVLDALGLRSTVSQIVAAPGT